MYQSPAMKHKARVKKALALKAVKAQADKLLLERDADSPPDSPEVLGSDYPTALISLKANLDLLKGRSIPEKIELKKALVPIYKGFIQDYIDNEENFKNEVLVTMIIWLLDVEDIECALQFAFVAIEQNQSMPERFKRDLVTYVVETVCTWAELQYEKELSSSPYFDEVLDMIVSGEWSVSQMIVDSKCYRIAGMISQREGEYQKAVEWYEMCMKVNPKGHGVKTKHAECVTKLKKQND
ncbi:MAG: terminase [Gammaproteobacteria bacterium]|nr:terminase [Gammaproteobacteria bacterium]